MRFRAAELVRVHEPCCLREGERGEREVQFPALALSLSLVCILNDGRLGYKNYNPPPNVVDLFLRWCNSQDGINSQGKVA